MMGTRIGVRSAVMSVAILLGSPIGGQLLEHNSFAEIQVFTGTAMVTASCIFLIAKRKIIKFVGEHFSSNIIS
jgi:predicted MFS family arabinose efflux permease